MNLLRMLSVGVLLFAAGCASEDDGRMDGPVLTSVGGADVGMTAEVVGQLNFQNGCLLLDGSPVIWPESTSWDADTQALTLPSGDGVPVGQVLTGGGGFLPLSVIAESFGDDVAEAAEPCLGTTGEVAVFNPGSDVGVES